MSALGGAAAARAAELELGNIITHTPRRLMPMRGETVQEYHVRRDAAEETAEERRTRVAAVNRALDEGADPTKQVYFAHGGHRSIRRQERSDNGSSTALDLAINAGHLDVLQTLLNRHPLTAAEARAVGLFDTAENIRQRTQQSLWPVRPNKVRRWKEILAELDTRFPQAKRSTSAAKTGKRPKRRGPAGGGTDGGPRRVTFGSGPDFQTAMRKGMKSIQTIPPGCTLAQFNDIVAAAREEINPYANQSAPLDAVANHSTVTTQERVDALTDGTQITLTIPWNRVTAQSIAVQAEQALARARRGDHRNPRAPRQFDFFRWMPFLRRHLPQRNDEVALTGEDLQARNNLRKQTSRIMHIADLVELEDLLDHGVDPNSRSPSGETPLMEAAREGKYPEVKLLLEKGANVLLKDGEGNDALTHVHAVEHEGDNAENDADDIEGYLRGHASGHAAVKVLLREARTKVLLR